MELVHREAALATGAAVALEEPSLGGLLVVGQGEHSEALGVIAHHEHGGTAPRHLIDQEPVGCVARVQIEGAHAHSADHRGEQPDASADLFDGCEGGAAAHELEVWAEAHATEADDDLGVHTGLRQLDALGPDLTELRVKATHCERLGEGSIGGHDDEATLLERQGQAGRSGGQGDLYLRLRHDLTSHGRASQRDPEDADQQHAQHEASDRVMAGL